MAKLNKEILGKVKGSLGEITFRQHKGKSYLSTRPSSFTPGKDEASIARREKFRQSIKLAKSIYSIPELKQIWTADAAPEVLPFNHLMRTNYSMIGSGGILTSIIRLAPSLGFNVNNPIVTLGPAEIKVNLDAIGNSSGIDVLNEPSLKLIAVVCLGNPSDGTLKKDEFLTFVSEPKVIDIATPIEFNTVLSDVENQMFAIYQNRKGFFAVVTLDAAGNVAHYSNTFAG